MITLVDERVCGDLAEVQRLCQCNAHRNPINKKLLFLIQKNNYNLFSKVGTLQYGSHLLVLWNGGYRESCQIMDSRSHFAMRGGFPSYGPILKHQQ